jgi:hypothetical protein
MRSSDGKPDSPGNKPDANPSSAEEALRQLVDETALEQAALQPIREGKALKRVLWPALGVSLIYGLVARLTFGFSQFEPAGLGVGDQLPQVFSVMSVAFLCGVPFAMGFAAVYLAKIQSWVRALFFAQLVALMALALAVLFAIEGVICVAFWLPAYMSLTALGGLVAWAVVRTKQNRAAFLGGVMLLPYGVAVTEQAVPTDVQRRVVRTKIEIDAPPAAVWEEIVDVPFITEGEHGFAWSHVIGFPRPVSARASSREVGALREAKFERGVVFYERVTRCEPEHALEFDISVDSRSIPKDALDEHVTLGGPYFDVLTGAYRIEPRGDGGVTLHLSSDHRLSTHFNGYASWWTDFVMRDTQDYILEIVARRAEQRAATKR